MALIEYFWGDSSLFVYAISSQEIHFQMKKPDAFFKDQCKEFIEMVNHPSLSTSQNDSAFFQFTQLSQQLYKMLSIGDLRSFFPNIKNLIIIPDGILGYLPFDLLISAPPTENDNFSSLPYLLKDYNIRYAYSATLLLDKYKQKHSSRQLYAGYAPQYISEELFADNTSPTRIYAPYRSGFAALQNNQQEVQEAAQLFEGISLLGARASEAAFKQDAHKYQILHLAMHTLINDSLPLYSGLVFSQDQDSLEDDFLYAYELYNMQLNAELAVLSACQTGIGKIQRGEGIMSLARAFMYAGCPNIAMSLWQADDEATAEIMTAFMAYLKDGMGKAEALRRAKLNYLAGAPGGEISPLLLGNPL